MSAAERMRIMRARRREGVRATQTVEVTPEAFDLNTKAAIRAGYITSIEWMNA